MARTGNISAHFDAPSVTKRPNKLKHLSLTNCFQPNLLFLTKTQNGKLLALPTDMIVPLKDCEGQTLASLASSSKKEKFLHCLTPGRGRRRNCCRFCRRRKTRFHCRLKLPPGVDVIKLIFSAITDESSERCFTRRY